jgi:hypothetical protein
MAEQVGDFLFLEKFCVGFLAGRTSSPTQVADVYARRMFIDIS